MYSIFEELCSKRGIKPYQVCKATGLSTSSISNWKAGRYSPKADKLAKIADFFGVSVEYLMTGIESEKESITGKKYHFSDEAAEMAQKLTENPHMRMLFEAARGARPEDLKMAADMLRRFKESGQELGPDG
jgi:transcriptional regulator with XRE-family HTH domain